MKLIPKSRLDLVFLNFESMRDTERAYAAALSEGAEMSIVGNSDFQLKRWLAADLAFAVKRSGHSFMEAASDLAIEAKTLEAICRGLVNNASLGDLVRYLKALLDRWQSSIPDWVMAEAGSTLSLVEAQAKSNALRENGCATPQTSPLPA